MENIRNIQKVVIINSKRRKIALDNKKTSNNIKYKSILYYKKYYNICIYLLINLFSIYLSNEKILLSKLNKFSEINLTIKGNGTQSIINNAKRDIESKTYRFNNIPSEILVNDIKINNSGFKVSGLINEENNITIRWNYSFSFCGLMFFNLYNITRIDLSNFDSSQCTDMILLFCNCDSLTSINLRNFNTSLVTNMRNLFFNCPLLISLDLSSFDTSMVTNMYGMFYNCKLIKSLDLSNFNTSLVVDMHGLFYNCFSLSSLDIRSFDTSLVIDLAYMFCNCQSLKYLNLSHFYTQSTNTIRCIFYNCTSLTSLDISNFNTSLVTNMNAMFYNCLELKSLNIKHFDTSHVNTMISMFYSCKSLISLDLSNFNTQLVTNMTKMFSDSYDLKFLNINSFDTSLVENMDNIFSNCKSLISLDLSKFNTSLVTSMKMMFNNCESLKFLELDNFDFSSVSDMTDILNGCNDNLIYCIKNDNDSLLLNNYTYENNCSYICQSKSKKYIYENNNCVYNCYDDKIYKFEYNNECYQECPNGTYALNKIYLCINISLFDMFYDLYKNNNSNNEIIENVRNELINDTLDLLIDNIIEKGKEDLIYYKNNIIYQITSTFNQNNNIYYNISSIDFQECEKRLRLQNNINDNITLLIYKVDILLENLLIPIIEYEIYNSETKVKLNLNICKDTKAKIYIPVSIDESNLFKYNSSSEYYNDICYPYTSEYKTDIILEDRRNEYIDNNMSLCENNCEYIKYDFKEKKVECDCFVKNNFTYDSELSNYKDFLLNNFVNYANIMNINVIKCYKTLFTKEGLINNIGSYIFVSIILFEIILLIIFIKKGYKMFENEMRKILSFLVNINRKNNNKKNKKSFHHNSQSEIRIFDKITNQRNSNIIFKVNIKNDINKINNKAINNYNDYELNNLSYEEALEKDKRSYLQYYFSLLRTKHLLIFTFYTNTDYNSKIIKISLFLFSFGLYYTINALFFNDSTLHKIYINKGSFNIIFQIIQAFYSSIISYFISLIIKFLSLSEKSIIEIKKEKKNIKEEGKKTLKCLLIKFIFYYVLTFLFLFFFWYYISCFCAVYRNTQMYLLKDTLISFGLSLLYPFGISLIPGVFRIISLKSIKKDSICLYKFSKLLQIV